MTDVSDLEKEMEELSMILFTFMNSPHSTEYTHCVERRKMTLPSSPPARYPEFEQIWKSLHDTRDKYQYFKVCTLLTFA
jgi:hypothetical protein